MSSSQNTARTTEEGGAVDLESPLWPDTGTEPTDADNYAYAAYEEPGAGPDNAINYKVTYDHGQLNYELGKAFDRINDLESRIDTLRSDLDDLESSYGSHNHDSRYYTKSQSDDRHVDESGDTMTGTLRMDREGTTTGALEAFGETSKFSIAVQDGNGRSSQYWNVESGSQNIITENEGAAWWFIGDGTAHLDLYDGTSGDAGSPPSWSRVLSADTGGITFDNGASFGSNADFDSNLAENISKATFSTAGNDFLTVDDASGGSNGDPLTLKYSGRPLRFFAGDSSTSSLELGTGGAATLAGDVALDKAASTLSLGTGAGPHELSFGNDDSGGGLSIVMRTSPNKLTVENTDSSTIWATDQDKQTVNFSNTEYVVLPVRGGDPSNPPSGATWIET